MYIPPVAQSRDLHEKGKVAMDNKEIVMKNYTYEEFQTIANLSTEIMLGVINSLAHDDFIKNGKVEPGIGDWCAEMSAGDDFNLESFGILAEVTECHGEKTYVIETIMGRRMYWSQCIMHKIPCNLIDEDARLYLLQFLKDRDTDVNVK